MVNVIQILFIYIYNAIIKINIDKESNFEARCCGQYLIKISNTLRQLLNYIQDRDIHSIYKFYICLCIFKYYTKHIVIKKQQLLTILPGRDLGQSQECTANTGTEQQQ